MEWKVSDILTILIIAGGVFTFGFSACKDRELKRLEHADKVRWRSSPSAWEDSGPA
jgi:hypothetical protein